MCWNILCLQYGSSSAASIQSHIGNDANADTSTVLINSAYICFPLKTNSNTVWRRTATIKYHTFVHGVDFIVTSEQTCHSTFHSYTFKYRKFILVISLVSRCRTISSIRTAHCKNIKVTSTIHLVVSVGCLLCMWHITNFKGGYQPHSECSGDASSFVKIVSPFRMRIAFLMRLVFLWSYTSVPVGMPWLHGCSRNARSVTK